MELVVFFPLRIQLFRQQIPSITRLCPPVVGGKTNDAGTFGKDVSHAVAIPGHCRVFDDDIQPVVGFAEEGVVLGEALLAAFAVIEARFPAQHFHFGSGNFFQRQALLREFVGENTRAEVRCTYGRYPQRIAGNAEIVVKNAVFIPAQPVVRVADVVQRFFHFVPIGVFADDFEPERVVEILEVVVLVGVILLATQAEVVAYLPYGEGIETNSVGDGLRFVAGVVFFTVGEKGD